MVRKSIWQLCILISLLLAVACQPVTIEVPAEPDAAAAPQVEPTLVELRDIAQLKASFNAQTDRTRLLLLLSPT
jgi:hypothetical protein